MNQTINDVEECISGLQIGANQEKTQQELGSWACRVCTFINGQEVAVCEMCNTLCISEQPTSPVVHHPDSWQRSMSSEEEEPLVSSFSAGDRLGDHLRQQLAASDNSAALTLYCLLNEELRGYDREQRSLVRLANTGGAVVVLKRAIDSTLGILNKNDLHTTQLWHQELEKERRQRVQFFEILLCDEELLTQAAGDEKQQLEVLTLMKHDLDLHSDILLSVEVDVMAAMRDAVARRSNSVVSVVPKWFVTASAQRIDAQNVEFYDSNEAFVRQMNVWEELNHPNVRKCYGACHVGKQFVVCQGTYQYAGICFGLGFKWKYCLGWALGLQYLHKRGFVHGRWTAHTLRFTTDGKGMRSGRGILSGLGLLRLGESVRYPRAVLTMKTKLILYFFLGISRQTYSSEDSEGEFELKHEESCLLEKMLADDPAKRIDMDEVVHMMTALAEDDESGNFHDYSEDDSAFEEGHKVDRNSCSSTATNASTYVIPTVGQTIGEVLTEAGEMCDSLDDHSDLHRSVYNRLADVYGQLMADSELPSLSCVELLAGIVWRFFLQVDQSSDNLNSVAATCASRTIAGRNFGLHHDIDQLMLSLPRLERTAVIHDWQTKLKGIEQKENEMMAVYVADPSADLLGVGSEDYAETSALLQYESPSVPRSEVLPTWFIPAYEVGLEKALAEGSFGSVYLGKWLNTEVAVKKLKTGGLGADSYAEFRHEASLWFSLNHPSLLKLFGACHVGRPFFVCEFANLGTASVYLKGKPWREVWWSLHRAALGLEHLHLCGIIHGDLKGNNILVSGDKHKAAIKLADFGLSSFVNRSEEGLGTSGAVGAFRWKAPECLRGEPPSFASDIYSFGMCVLEIATGEYPWGMTISDTAVKLNVAVKKLLPQRPEKFTNSEWDFVERMCCFDPARRLTAGAVVAILHNMLSEGS